MDTSSLSPLPPPHVVVVVVGIILVLLRPCNSSAVDEDRSFWECRQEFDCGLIRNLTYPFWGGARPKFCGSLPYELVCRENEYPIMNNSGRDFRVLQVNQSRGKNAISIRWMGSERNWCPEKIDLLGLYFPSFKPSTANITVLYDCKGHVNMSEVSNFTCQANGREIRGMFIREGRSSRTSRWECEEVEVPVKREALELEGAGSVNLEEILREGFDVNYLAFDWYCGQCEDSGGRCGSNSSSPELFACHCLNGPQQISCPKAKGSNSRINWKLKLLVGAASTIVGLLILSILAWKMRDQARKSFGFARDPTIEAFIRNHGTLSPRRYKFSEVKRITSSFKRKLGQGGYGGVYQGKLEDGRLVAVKVLNTSKGDGQDFINEVASISRTSHVNVVSLLGFCLEGKTRALIYEFMPNGSLEKFIFKKNDLTSVEHLGWEKLYNIALGIARGLQYLHQGCNTRIVHFDIKPHNILLDENFHPKISDFGLAKLCTRNESILSMMEARGTIGYIAPEVFSRNFGVVSHKSDVYSYGMMVLEMAGGRRNLDVQVSQTSEVYFPHLVYRHLEQGTELKLQGVITSEGMEIVRKMIMVGLWCIQPCPSDRPSMSKVLEMFEGSIQALQIPPNPFLSSPPRLPQESTSTLCP